MTENNRDRHDLRVYEIYNLEDLQFMKILNTIFSQTTGGVDSVFCNYNKCLIDDGHELFLAISNNKYCNYQASKIFKLKNISPILDCFHLLYICYKIKPDVIICHSPRSMIMAGYLKYFIKAKSIAINHSMSYKKSMKCDYVISVNQEINDALVKCGFPSKKSFVLSNAIEVSEKFKSKKLSPIVKIGLYGRLDYNKGFDILIKAAKIINERGVDFRLKLGGFETSEGLRWQDIKKMTLDAGIKEKCQFIGKIVDKKTFFTDVDLFCAPSRHEAFGMVMLEAFLYSTLVISSDTDGGKQLIKDQESGLLFKNENPSDLADKIILATERPDTYNIMTKNAYRELKDKYSLDILQKRLENILLKIIN